MGGRERVRYIEADGRTVRERERYGYRHRI